MKPFTLATSFNGHFYRNGLVVKLNAIANIVH